jgi:drug/metabolite transporter (DMT)-like permease
MTDTLFAAALASAFLHAAWNAGLKASADTHAMMSGQLVVAAVFAVIGLFFTGVPSRAAIGPMLASSCMSLGVMVALLQAYRRADFGVVYPVNRALSVVLVLAASLAFFGESVRPLAVLGVVIIGASVLLLALGEGAMPARAFAWTCAAGVFTAGAALSDGHGARASASPAAYGFTLTLMNLMTWNVLLRVQGRTVRLGGAGFWPRAFAVGVASTLSYLLILWVWARVPIAIGAALRDTSAIFAALIAIFVLKEKLRAKTIVAVLMATVGAVCIRLA